MFDLYSLVLHDIIIVYNIRIHADYLSKSERRESENNFDIGSRDLIGDNFTPPDSSMNGDDDDTGEMVKKLKITTYLSSQKRKMQLL